MDPELSFELQKAWRPSFYQALQLVRCFDFDPGSPTTAAFLSTLFLRLQMRPSLERLHSWLRDYIAPFVPETPRNLTDLDEKTLAIAVYLHISDQDGFKTDFKDESLINYLEYASSQTWLNNQFLAFYCHSLKGPFHSIKLPEIPRTMVSVRTTRKLVLIRACG